MLVQQSGVILSNGATLSVQTGGSLTLSNKDGIINTDGTHVGLFNDGQIVVQPTSTDNFATKINVPITNSRMYTFHHFNF